MNSRSLSLWARASFESATLFAIAAVVSTSGKFWWTVFWLHVGWYGVTLAIGVYTAIRDAIVFRVVRSLVVEETVRNLSMAGLPTLSSFYDGSSYYGGFENGGSTLEYYADYTLNDPTVPDKAKFQLGAMLGVHAFLKGQGSWLAADRLESVFSDAVQQLHKQARQNHEAKQYKLQIPS